MSTKSSSSSFPNTKRRKDKKKAVTPTGAPARLDVNDDDDDTGKTKKKKKKTLTFQEKIAKAHAARNVKRQKQMFMDVVLSKEFGTEYLIANYYRGGVREDVAAFFSFPKPKMMSTR